jgi:hypothetical protein
VRLPSLGGRPEYRIAKELIATLWQFFSSSSHLGLPSGCHKKPSQTTLPHKITALHNLLSNAFKSKATKTNHYTNEKHINNNNMSGLEFSAFIWALPVAVAMITQEVITLRSTTEELTETVRLEEQESCINPTSELEQSIDEPSEDSIEVTLEDQPQN